jgi:hypothetical protein
MSGTSLQALEIELKLVDDECWNIGRASANKLKELDKKKQTIKKRFVDAVNSKSKGVLVEELYPKVMGMGKVAVGMTLSDIVITDLKTPDGKSIGVKQCEDMHGQYNHMNELVPANSRISIAYKNDGINKGDILLPI